MASFAEQMSLHNSARAATSSLEAASRAAIEAAFRDWDTGALDARTVRYTLEAVVRNAYRSSASIARQVARESSDMRDWKPGEVFNTEYLQSLIDDVRLNLRKVKKGELTQAQAISRIQHSAGVGAQRGYTDQIVSAFAEMQEFGYRVRKYWVANFVNNDPCQACRRLHGTHVGIHESFKTETGEPGVYRDLVGPPRHPRCQCKLYVFVVSLENAFEEPTFEAPEPSAGSMTSEEVRGLPDKVFAAVKASLSALLRFLRRR